MNDKRTCTEESKEQNIKKTKTKTKAQPYNVNKMNEHITHNLACAQNKNKTKNQNANDVYLTRANKGEENKKKTTQFFSSDKMYQIQSRQTQTAAATHQIT